MCEYFNKNQTLEKINEISSMHPYPIPGEPGTYNAYNQGWSDACRLISDLIQFDPPSMVAEIPCKVGDFLWSIIRPVGLHLKAKVVMLLPARTDTKWFHDYIYGNCEIRFLRGRLKFVGAKNGAPFPSMIAIFK